MSKSKGSVAFYKGSEVEVQAVSGGWTTVIKNDGSTAKVRNSELTAAPESSGRATKNGAAGRAKAPKSEAPKKREPRPSEKAAEGTEPTRVVNPDMARYTVHTGVRTGSGRRAVDINDDAATQLRGLDLDEVYAKVCSTLSLDEAAIREQYAHLNPGMQRMNLGNRLRAFIKNQAAGE